MHRVKSVPIRDTFAASNRSHEAHVSPHDVLKRKKTTPLGEASSETGPIQGLLGPHLMGPCARGPHRSGPCVRGPHITGPCSAVRGQRPIMVPHFAALPHEALRVPFVPGASLHAPET